MELAVKSRSRPCPGPGSATRRATVRRIAILLQLEPAALAPHVDLEVRRELSLRLEEFGELIPPERAPVIHAVGRHEDRGRHIATLEQRPRRMEHVRITIIEGDGDAPSSTLAAGLVPAELDQWHNATAKHVEVFRKMPRAHTE
jgi:hypothetical protein